MTQFNAVQYDIEKPTGVCAVTGRTLESGERFFATLIELSTEQQREHQKRQQKGKDRKQAAAAALGFRRLDFSAEAWEQGHRPKQVFSYWKSTVPQPAEKKGNLLVDNAVLLNLLHRLGNAEQIERLRFRYVLALILMRKRMIRYDGSVRRETTLDGDTTTAPFWQFTPKLDPSKGPMSKWDEAQTIEVLDPGLDESQIQDVTAQLGEILEAEL
jgi:hypothetical protein